MAVKSKKGKTVDKWRKKKYFPVLAPKIFQERELGRALAYDSASL
jgi:ribosomal protein S3AE